MGLRHDEDAEWTLLGAFAGGALAFVRELLQGEGVAHREALLPARDGEPRGELWVATAEHERATALLAAAQAEAESAAHREAAALAAEAARAAEAAAHAAEEEARRHAAIGRHAAHAAARRAARLARREARRAAREARWHERAIEVGSADSQRGMHLVGGVLVAFIFAMVIIAVIGEHYGTRRPSSGHIDTGTRVHRCGPKQLICY